MYGSKLRKTAPEAGFFMFDFTSVDLFEPDKEMLQTGNRTGGSWGSLTTVTLAAVPVFLRPGQKWVDIIAIFRDLDEYCGLLPNPVPSGGVDLDILSDLYLLWAEAVTFVEA